MKLRVDPPVVLEKGHTDADERQHEVQAEQMPISKLETAARRTKAHVVGQAEA